MKFCFVLVCVSALGLSSCRTAVGTCTCTCLISGVGTTVKKLTGSYTEGECTDAADITATGESANACGEFSDGSVTCNSSWAESN